MSAAEKKILAAIREHPGLLWYEVGLLVYPRSGKQRTNLFGKPFVELSGRGLSLTHDAVFALYKRGEVRQGRDNRLFIRRRPKP